MATNMKSRSQKSKPRRSAAVRSIQLVVQIDNSQRSRKVDTRQLRAAVQAVLASEGIERASISLAVVDDPTIHELNRRYLDHDEPTDVISFVLDQADGIVDGQIVVSADTAAASAKRFGWKTGEELLLYVIHGTLHLTGYDDRTPKARRAMRQQERRYLAGFGLRPRYRKTSNTRARSSRR
jgi:probable rRNA maturation factor